jgi:tetratricopeptide (TPR) repeat protein
VRLRQRRVELGLTQSDLADGRLSKAYVSQVELGKTAPSEKTLAWLADRVGVDLDYLRSGISTADRASVLDALARADELTDTHDYDAALVALDGVAPQLRACDEPTLLAGFSAARAWPLIQLGRLDEAEQALDRASNDARVVYLRGVAAYKHSEIDGAMALLTEAIRLAGAGEATERLCSDAHGWRSRCHRRNGDWAAAAEDAEIAVELATGAGDTRRAAYAYFQASLVHERLGELIQARNDAQRALQLYEQLDDSLNRGRTLNNLAAFEHMLGSSHRALELLDESLALALENASLPDTGHVLCSLAEVQLAVGEHALAEANARRALRMLDGREDYLHEIGIAQLTLADALLQRGQIEQADAAADDAHHTFEAIKSAGHTASALITRGDVEAARGATGQAAALYRAAATALLPDPAAAIPD